MAIGSQPNTRNRKRHCHDVESEVVRAPTRHRHDASERLDADVLHRLGLTSLTVNLLLLCSIIVSVFVYLGSCSESETQYKATGVTHDTAPHHTLVHDRQKSRRVNHIGTHE